MVKVFPTFHSGRFSLLEFLIFHLFSFDRQPLIFFLPCHIATANQRARNQTSLEGAKFKLLNRPPFKRGGENMLGFICHLHPLSHLDTQTDTYTHGDVTDTWYYRYSYTHHHFLEFCNCKMIVQNTLQSKCNTMLLCRRGTNFRDNRLTTSRDLRRFLDWTNPERIK